MVEPIQEFGAHSSLKKICLCGSFRFFDLILKLEKTFSDTGLVCYRPSPFKYRSQSTPSEFADSWSSLSDQEKLRESKRAELSHFDKIEKADLIYIVNPGGYIGFSVTLEIGYAYAKGKELYSLDRIEDYAVMSLIHSVVSPEELTDKMKSKIV